MKLLRRLFFGPLLIKLHRDHSVLVVQLREQTKKMYLAFNLDPFADHRAQSKKVEILAEKLADLDERMERIWG